MIRAQGLFGILAFKYWYDRYDNRLCCGWCSSSVLINRIMGLDFGDSQNEIQVHFIILILCALYLLSELLCL